MTRAIGRRKEFAVRAALGATRGDLLRQLLAESLLRSTARAAVGLLAAHWGIDVLIAAIPNGQLQSMPYLQDAGINPMVLGFLRGVTLLTAVLFGLAPAFTASQSALNQQLKEETRGGTSGRNCDLSGSPGWSGPDATEPSGAAAPESGIRYYPSIDLQCESSRRFLSGRQGVRVRQSSSGPFRTIFPVR